MQQLLTKVLANMSVSVSVAGLVGKATQPSKTASDSVGQTVQGSTSGMRAGAGRCYVHLLHNITEMKYASDA